MVVGFGIFRAISWKQGEIVTVKISPIRRIVKVLGGSF